MQPNIKIFLPLHVSSSDVFAIISKALNVENWKRQFNPKVNINQPCAMGNVWDVVFTHPYDSLVHFVNEDQDIIKVRDMMDQKYILNFYHSGLIDGYIVGNEKVIVTPANALMGAIGKKLVDFYSGKMIISNSSNISSAISNIDSDNNFINASSESSKLNSTNSIYESSTFIHAAPIKGRSAKKYIYQFNNHLADLNAVTPQELVEMRQRGLWQSTDHILLYNMDEQFAKSYFAMEDLTKSLNNNPNENQPIKKMKI